MQEIIPLLHEKCGIPVSVWSEMKRTSALDGRQSYSIKNLTISWKYHPDNGLEAIYSATR